VKLLDSFRKWQCKKLGHNWCRMRINGYWRRVCMRCPVMQKMTDDEVETMHAVHASDSWEDAGYFDGR